MKATDRLRDESRFHDQQAAGRAARFHDPAALAFTDDEYLDHESWVRPAMATLAAGPGMTALDLGCGHGMAAVVLARAGAAVTAVDLSAGYLAEARRRAEANHVPVSFVQADGERLPFAEEAFDRVWGHAVLHHLDVEAAGREVWRVLRPGGVAVFCEPWGENPLLEFARRCLPYPGKERTRGERPLRRRDLKALRRAVPGVEVEGYQLLGMARRVLGHGAMARGLAWVDSHLLRRVPVLNEWCRYAVLTVRKGG